MKRKPKPGDPWYSPPTFLQKFHHIRWAHKFLYCFYIWVHVPLIITCSLLVFPIWPLPIKSLKPNLIILQSGGNYTFKAEYAPGDILKLGRNSPEARNARWTKQRDVLAPLGWGGVVRDKRDNGKVLYEPPFPETRRTRWRGFCMRVWDMYTLERDLIGMMTKQGLQLVGVWCGVTLLAMQVTMMATELSGGQVHFCHCHCYIFATLIWPKECCRDG